MRAYTIPFLSAVGQKFYKKYIFAFINDNNKFNKFMTNFVNSSDYDESFSSDYHPFEMNEK